MLNLLYSLENCFKEAKSSGAKYVAITTRFSEMDRDEIIINPIENVEDKLKYYKKAYTDDLRLKAAPEAIHIAGFTYGNSFEDIEKDLMK